MNPNIVAVFAAIRGLLIAVGAAMVTLNLGDTHAYALVMQASGLVMVAGPVLWAIFEKLVTLKKMIAAAVQAGINMTVQGKAVSENGQVISKFSADAQDTPPKAVTIESAKDIVANFAPSTSTITKS